MSCQNGNKRGGWEGNMTILKKLIEIPLFVNGLLKKQFFFFFFFFFSKGGKKSFERKLRKMMKKKKKKEKKIVKKFSSKQLFFLQKKSVCSRWCPVIAQYVIKPLLRTACQGINICHRK